MAGAANSQEDAITDINMTPLVDVSLVLVIIFMAVAPFAVQAGIKVLESKAKAMEGKSALSDSVNVTLKEDGTLEINGKRADFATLPASLQEALLGSKEKMVVISADERNKVGQVVEILDAAKQAGALKLAILKSETPAPSSAKG